MKKAAGYSEIDDKSAFINIHTLVKYTQSYHTVLFPQDAYKVINSFRTSNYFLTKFIL